MHTEKQKRIVVIPRIDNVFASLTTIGGLPGYVKVPLCGTSLSVDVYERVCLEGEFVESIYNFPFMFGRNGVPWYEANAFILDYMCSRSVKSRPSDLARKYAGRLIDYALFCEREGIDWLDFTGVRISHRPTYRYFSYLSRESGFSRAVINQCTGIVYRLYQYVGENWHSIDMSRVDTTKTIKFLVGSDNGISKSITADVRSQTLPISKAKQAPMGFCLDEGESLRPLSNIELSGLLQAIQQPDWPGQEPLIVMFALMTGARKQSVLTIRYKHIKRFENPSPRSDGSYVLNAGPGTGIDTKSDKPQVLYVPKQLASELLIYSKSRIYQRRRREFIAKREVESHGAEIWDEEEVYLFLSEQANCFYMAKSDPKYVSVKDVPVGQMTRSLQERITRFAGSLFPKDFSFHWLRATYAYQLYQQLVPLMNSRHLAYVDAVSIIQTRMHHEDRVTTENYLKLFTMHNEKLKAQELYEERLFGFSTYVDFHLHEVEGA